MTLRVLIDAMLPWRLANMLHDHGHADRHVRGLKDLGKDDIANWRAPLANTEMSNTCDYGLVQIKDTSGAGKLLLYRSPNLNRMGIVQGFETRLRVIVAFASSSETSLKIP